MDENGNAIVAYCSRPHITSDHKQNHRANAIVYNGGNTNVEVKPGYCAMLGRHHAPYWTEINYRSQNLRCGGTVQ